MFKNKMSEKRGATGAKGPIEESNRAGSSKGSKKRGWEGSNIARTVRAAGQLPTPPPSRSVRATSPPTDDFNCPIPTAVAVPVSALGGSTLALLGGDRSFSWVVSFKLPPSLEGEIRSVLEDDLLDSGIEMIYRGLVLARRGADARRCRAEDVSRLEHDLQKAGHDLKQAVEANTTYEKKLCAQAAELELRKDRLAEVEKADADKAAEITLLRKALEAADRRAALLEKEAAAKREGKEVADAEVLKTMEDTMVLINQSFDLVVRQAEVLYDGPPPSGRFDQEMEVVDGRLVPTGGGQLAEEGDPSTTILNVEDQGGRLRVLLFFLFPRGRGVASTFWIDIMKSFL